MNTEILTPQLIDSVQTADQMKAGPGHESIGEKLGVARTVPEAVRMAEAALLDRKLLSDGTSLFHENAVVDEIRQMPAGSIVGVTITQTALHEVPERFVQAHEVVATKLATTESGVSIFWGAIKRDDGGKWAAWGRSTVNETVVDQRDDVIQALQTFLRPEQRLEAYQALSAMFRLNTHQTLIDYEGRQTLNAAGCFTHEKASKAMELNLLLGEASAYGPPLTFPSKKRNQYIRLRFENLELLPLAHPADKSLDSNKVFRMGFAARAEEISKKTGRDSKLVRGAMNTAASELPELFASDASIELGQKILVQNIT